MQTALNLLAKFRRSYSIRRPAQHAVDQIMEGAFLRCIALECDARTSRALTYWCETLEMDGIGEKLIDALLDSGLVKNTRFVQANPLTINQTR